MSGKVDQYVNELATKPADLSLIPDTHTMEGEN